MQSGRPRVASMFRAARLFVHGGAQMQQGIHSGQLRKGQETGLWTIVRLVWQV